MIPLPDLGTILGIALACAGLVGVAGWVALRLTRRMPILVQMLVVVLTAMLSVWAGLFAVAQAMFLSPHDFTVGMWISGVATVVSLGAAVVLSRTLTRQAERLRRLAQDLGAGKPVDAQESGNDRSEFAQLEGELARTARRLQASRDEVSALDASRRDVITWISHDLRTPLAGLRAMAEALEDGMAPDPQRFLRQMRLQVDHLSALVEELFELSKIQSGRLLLSKEPVSLYDIVSDAVAELRALADAHQITITESPGPDPTILGDARELARVVGNLLINAIEHSPPGSEISVATRQNADGTAQFSIVDSGGGIPEADLAHVFVAGWRGNTPRTPSPSPALGRSSGAGLGLAIAHGIVAAHDGDISARNVSGGCRFDVRLPSVVGS